MDRLSQLRGEAGGSKDSTLDTTSPPSEAYMSANDSSSKYFSLSDSTFDIAPIKDVSLASTSADGDGSTTADDNDLLPNLSPIAKKELIDSYKIDSQIEAANILSGGVDIFDDNDNSFDGDELVIDDNVDLEDKSNDVADAAVDGISDAAPVANIGRLEPPIIEPELQLVPDQELVVPENELVAPEQDLVEPKQNLVKTDQELVQAEQELVESEQELVEPEQGLVESEQDLVEPEQDLVQPEQDLVQPEQDLVETEQDLVESEQDLVEPEQDLVESEQELVVAEQELVVADQELVVQELEEPENELVIIEPEADPACRDMEVILQVNGNNVNAINIGNGLYLYRKGGNDELAAIQILDDNDPQHNFKFLKVRDNAEGNLEVYEEIEVEVPAREKKPANNASVSINANKIAAGPSTSKDQNKQSTSSNEPVASTSKCELTDDKEKSPDSNMNGKMMKFSESRRSPVVGSFTSTYHSTPIKEGKPLTKTMIDQQLHPNRHSDNVRTIEVHTENIKPKSIEKDNVENAKSNSLEVLPGSSNIVPGSSQNLLNKSESRVKGTKGPNVKRSKPNIKNQSSDSKPSGVTEEKPQPAVIKENDVLAQSQVLELQNKDKKSDDSNQGPIESEIVKESDVVSKPDKSNDVVPTTTSKPTPVIENSIPNKETESLDKTLVAPDNIDISKSNSISDKNIGILDKTLVEPSTSETVNTDIKESNSSLDKKNETVDKTLAAPSTSGPLDTDIKTSNSISDKKTDTIETTLVAPDNLVAVDIETPKKTAKEAIKSPDIDNAPVSNSNNEILKPVNDIIEEKKIIVENAKELDKKDTSKSGEKVQNVKTDEVKDSAKNNVSPTKEVKKDSAVAIDLTDTCVKDNVDLLKPDDEIMNFPIESFAEVSSSMSIATDESKAESITLYAIDTDESVSLITPSSTIKGKDDKINLDPTISEALTKMSNTNNEIKNTTINNETVAPAIKDPRIETKDQVDSTTKVTSSLSKPEEKSKTVVEKNNSQDTIRPTSSQIEKATSSVALPKTKSSDKILPCISLTVVKPPEKNKTSIPIPQVKTFEKVTNISNSTEIKFKPATEAKCLKNRANPISMSGTKPDESLRITPGQGMNASKKPELIPASNAKSSDKGPQLTLKSESKASENNAHPSSKFNNKPPEKNINYIVVAKPLRKTADVKIVTSTTSNKPIKSDSHVPIVAMANKPSCKLIPPVITLKKEEIKKSNESLKETVKTALHKNATQIKIESRETKDQTNKPSSEQKPVNNNHAAAVPFGKWTDANRQEFLNKFKEVKAPAHSNSKQIKNSNDLNRRDVLQKIDSQRAQTIINNAISKPQDKVNVKNEAVFPSKVVPPKVETKIPVKSENVDMKPKNAMKKENPQKALVTSTEPDNSAVAATVSKTEPAPRDMSTATMASLIDRTIEDMINRVVPSKTVTDEVIQVVKTNDKEPKSVAQILTIAKEPSKSNTEDTSFDYIEQKMNELHGIPFVERPPHELPIIPKAEIKTYSKIDKVKTLKNSAPNASSGEHKVVKEKVDVDSEEEVIEHEPVTGDIELNKKSVPVKLPVQDKKPPSQTSTSSSKSKNATNKESIITETDFDKFVRRNSVSCENYLTVNYDRKETQNAQSQPTKEIVKDDHAPKLNLKHESTRIDPRSRLLHKKPMRHNVPVVAKNQGPTKVAMGGDSSNKKYQSKIHSAYQSAITAKHQIHPVKMGAQSITIIEDKPVKVVFVESSTGFVPSQLNVQGQELSPAKKAEPETDNAVVKNNDIVDLDVVKTTEQYTNNDKRPDKLDESKTKTKHQRKQVLTPVEAPELELIQPSEIGIETSPKKKRKIEEPKADKQMKNLVHKKSYLLGRNTSEHKTVNAQVSTKEDRKEDVIEHKDAASAIDNLVKAAELLENQPENLNNSITPNPDSQPNTPVKRGRGRPRKYPLPDGAVQSKSPSPQKKPRLIDAKPVKQDSFSDEHDEDSSGEEMVRVNWTMGKINENIVCPICNKLFRSENVVFKHVKHCTGVSPNRSDSDKRSPRRSRLSQESEDMDLDDEISLSETKKNMTKNRKSNESAKSETKLEVDKDDVIVIEDTPVKEKTERHVDEKEEETKNLTKDASRRSNGLICEFCGKKFRQLSHLVTHNLQHKKEQTKETEKPTEEPVKLQVFSCEVCKKEFRKLHHLVQHRIIHNPDSVPKRSLRKSSSEQNGTKNVKEEVVAKQNDDSSAAFRCEPCDKSFRKLHHLVEHRETHDGINRQKPSTPSQPTVEKPQPPPQCEICKKTFRKLHHLIEHKEQHADTSSEKSDDKSVKSALSTKDIIHECSLCYMVFPNEHSLTKHSVMCSKKKRQSKKATENDPTKEDPNSDEKKNEDNVEAPIIVAEEIIDDDESTPQEQNIKVIEVAPEVEKEVEAQPTITEVKQTENEKAIRTVVAGKPSQKEIEVDPTESQSAAVKRDLTKPDDSKTKEKAVVPEKIKKIDHKEVKAQETPKRKSSSTDKVAPATTKRKRTMDTPLPVVQEAKPAESSDDEVRYMFNPNLKIDDTSEGKLFMKVRTSKRNSLQIERPSSKDLVKRRTSLQHPPKIPRLKPKALKPKLRAAEPKQKALEVNAKLPERKSKTIEPKASTVAPATLKHIPVKSEDEAMLSTDSDDSDVKYSFPKTAPETPKSTRQRKTKEIEKKSVKKSITEKRKSLVGIAKRKSVGKGITTKHKVNSPAKPIRKPRVKEVEHRCDCGALFSSAALLSRHTSLAHTPPRIRRRRSSPPPPQPRPADLAKPKLATTRKSSVKTEARLSASTAKSKAEPVTPASARKSVGPKKSEVKKAKNTRRSAAHSGVPVPEKMKKIMMKEK